MTKANNSVKVVNNSRKYKCNLCYKEIVTPRKIVTLKNNRHHHISCIRKRAERILELWSAVNRVCKRYKNDEILEELSKDGNK